MLIRAFVLVCVAGAVLSAQEVELALRPPRDSALARARQLVLDGEGERGRKLADSVLAASASDGEQYAEALFWRGVLSGTAADAERSYRRLLIEAPLSDRAEEALLQLAQLEAARGNRRGASDHLYRYMLSYGNSPQRPARPRVSIWLVRLLFEQPDQQGRGCEAVQMSRDAIPPENVELRNQLNAYSSRCAYTQAAPSTPAEPVPSQQSSEPARPAAGAAPPPRSSAAPAGSYYSVQVAAYDSREAAQRMANLLVSRGLEARVDGTQRPFRVRVGRYATRAEAARMQQTLKAQGQNGFVAVVTSGARP
jgi:cell division septation protein DedD